MGPYIVIILKYISNKMQLYTVYFIWKLLYMFRVVPPPIFRRTGPDAVNTVVCPPEDGWRYRPKHVEQSPDKINCVTLRLVGYILEPSFFDANFCIFWSVVHLTTLTTTKISTASNKLDDANCEMTLISKESGLDLEGLCAKRRPWPGRT
jgi:hypothetical protein